MKPVVSYDLTPSMFPFVIEAYNPDGGEIVWTKTVEQPAPGERGGIWIPPLRKQLGHPVCIRITFADGRSYDSGDLKPRDIEWKNQ